MKKLIKYVFNWIEKSVKMLKNFKGSFLFSFFNKKFLKNISVFLLKNIIYIWLFFLIIMLLFLYFKYEKKDMQLILIMLLSIITLVIMNKEYKSKGDIFYVNLMFFYFNFLNLVCFFFWLYWKDLSISFSFLNNRFFFNFLIFSIIIIIYNNNNLMKKKDYVLIKVPTLDKYRERCIKVLKKKMFVYKYKQWLNYFFNILLMWIFLIILLKNLFIQIYLMLSWWIFFLYVIFFSAYIFIYLLHIICLLINVRRIQKSYLKRKEKNEKIN